MDACTGTWRHQRDLVDGDGLAEIFRCDGVTCSDWWVIFHPGTAWTVTARTAAEAFERALTARRAAR